MRKSTVLLGRPCSFTRYVECYSSLYIMLVMSNYAIVVYMYS
jgi:hypothetical protein